MASRTLIVNPKDEQKAAYQIAFEAEDLLIKSIKAGEKINSAYQTVKKFINDKNPNLGVHSNFGFGIGFNYKEDALTINAANQTVIKPGMTFHVRITLTNVHKDPSRSVIAIGDTVMVDEAGTPVLVTAGIQKKYSEISYSL
jgi:nucleosome binding factor SPN SPT16 subunit